MILIFTIITSIKFKELNLKRSTNRLVKGGFTLIEILVVLVIMGFLVAMVAPKLAGVVDGAVENTNKQSLQRFSDTINSYITKNKSIPPALTNLIRTNELAMGVAPAATSTIVLTTDHNDANGVDPISEEFSQRMLPMKHVLNAAEATELSKYIGGAVINLEAYAGGAEDGIGANRAATPVETYVRSKVQADLPVMMIGAGFTDSTNATGIYSDSNAVTMDGTTVAVSADTNATSTIAIAGDNVTTAGPTGGSNYVSGTTKTYARIAEAKNMMRIVMGISNRNQLVVKGYLDESGVSSGQKNAENDFTYGSYSLILPRLQATVDRFLANTHASGTLVQSGNTVAGTHNLLTFQAIKYDELDNGTLQVSARTPHMPPKNISGGILRGGQDMIDTTVVDPMGHNIGERGGWFGVKVTIGNGKDVG